MIDIEELMARLATRRALFCSEADFQHELAYELRRQDANLDLRLEVPLDAEIRGAVDLLVLKPSHYALELKYLCRKFTTQIDGEAVSLRQQSAHDIRRYDVCKDITRMERYAEQRAHDAGVLVLSNDPIYWMEGKTKTTTGAAFRLTDQRRLSGTLCWAKHAGTGTTRGREAPLEIKGAYPLHWRDYSDFGGRGGRFRYLWIPIAAPQAPAVSLGGASAMTDTPPRPLSRHADCPDLQ